MKTNLKNVGMSPLHFLQEAKNKNSGLISRYFYLPTNLVELLYEDITKQYLESIVALDEPESYPSLDECRLANSVWASKLLLAAAVMRPRLTVSRGLEARTGRTLDIPIDEINLAREHLSHVGYESHAYGRSRSGLVLSHGDQERVFEANLIAFQEIIGEFTYSASFSPTPDHYGRLF